MYAHGEMELIQLPVFLCPVENATVMLPSEEEILAFHENLPEKLQVSTAGKFYKACRRDPKRWLLALYAAKEWFGELYSGSEDYSADPVVLESSMWNYKDSVSMFATLKKLQLHPVIKDEPKLYRLHDLALEGSRFQPRVGDMVSVKPHKSCLSFSKRNIKEVPGRTEGNFDVVLESGFAAAAILWNTDCVNFLTKENRLYDEYAAKLGNTRALEDPSVASYSSVYNLERTCDLQSIRYGFKTNLALFYIVANLLTKLSYMPLFEEAEVIVHTGMKPFEAKLSSIMKREEDEEEGS
jgi:hypothetical protein